jgi:hypothetical protein
VSLARYTIHSFNTVFQVQCCNRRTATQDVQNPFKQGLSEHLGSTGQFDGEAGISTGKRAINEYRPCWSYVWARGPIVSYSVGMEGSVSAD